MVMFVLINILTKKQLIGLKPLLVEKQNLIITMTVADINTVLIKYT
jgi:hypothetical protein